MRVDSKVLLAFFIILSLVLTIPGFSQEAFAQAEPKITICHLPPGNPENIQTITVGLPSLPAHLDHGDGIGDCENDFAVITVVKNVINDDDGSKTPSDFTMLVTDSNGDVVTFFWLIFWNNNTNS